MGEPIDVPNSAGNGPGAGKFGYGPFSGGGGGVALLVLGADAGLVTLRWEAELSNARSSCGAGLRWADGRR